MSEKKKTAVQEPAAEVKKSKYGLELLSKYRSAIMGIAALWILFFHLWQKQVTEPGKLYDFESYIQRIGFCGVDIFLFLSGIGLVFAIGKSNILSFYYRRLKRVFLPFFIVGLIRCVTEEWLPDIFWKNVLGINFYKVSMYSFLWFVPAIITLYLLFPLYWKLFSRSSNKLVFTAAMFILWAGASVYFRADLREDLYGFTNRIPVFIFGVYAGWLTKNKKIEFTKTTWFMLIAVLATGLYYAYMANMLGWTFIVPVSNCSFPNMLIAVSFPFVIAKLLDMLCNIPKAGIIGKVINKFFGFFGMFSLELYCVQEWLGGKVLAEMVEKTPQEKNLMIFLVSTIAGVVLYLAVKYFWVLLEFVVQKIAGAVKKSRASAEEK